MASLPPLSNDEAFQHEERRIWELQNSKAFSRDRVAKTVGRLRVETVAPSLLRAPGVGAVLHQARAVEHQRTGEPWHLTRDDVLYAHLIRCYSVSPDTFPEWFAFQKERIDHLYRAWQAACARFWKADAPGTRLHELREDLVSATLSEQPLPTVLLYNGGLLHYGMTGDGLAGDPLQWTDLLAALLVLGLDVTLAVDKVADAAVRQPLLDSTSVVFTDYLGVDSLPILRGASVKCKLRVLDAYGTTEPFNHATAGRPFCCLGLPLPAFLTFLPNRSPHNTFLGFAMPRPSPHKFTAGGVGFERMQVKAPSRLRAGDRRNGKTRIKVQWVVVDQPDGRRVKRPQRQWLGVVLGKLGKYYDKPAVEPFLRKLAAHIPLVGTVGPDKRFVPDFMSNVGILKQTSYHALVQTAAMVVGIGEPLLGNGMLEAYATGAIAVNVEFPYPLELDGKPTAQGLLSQHPEVGALAAAQAQAAAAAQAAERTAAQAVDGGGKVAQSQHSFAFELRLDATDAEVKDVMVAAMHSFHDGQPFGHPHIPPGHDMHDFMATVLGVAFKDNWCKG